MPLSRRSLIFRSVFATITALVVLPSSYCGTFVFAAFLAGAGVLPQSTFDTMCNTVFVPVRLFGDECNWLYNIAFEAHLYGFRLRH